VDRTLLKLASLLEASAATEETAAATDDDPELTTADEESDVVFVDAEVVDEVMLFSSVQTYG
jgi:hypothetical protein